MNIVPEVIVIIMSVVVLSLVHLRSFLSFRGEALRLYAQRIRKKGEDEISLSLCLFVGGVKKKLEERERRRKDQSTGMKEVNEYDTE